MGWRSRVQINTVALSVATLLGIFALGFLGFAVYLALLVHYPPNIAAVLTASGYALLAVLVMVAAKIAVSRTKQFSSSGQNQLPDMDDLENIIQTMVIPKVSQMIHQHPVKSALATLLAGIIVGYNDDTRNAAKNACKRFYNQMK